MVPESIKKPFVSIFLGFNANLIRLKVNPKLLTVYWTMRAACAFLHHTFDVTRLQRTRDMAAVDTASVGAADVAGTWRIHRRYCRIPCVQ